MPTESAQRRLAAILAGDVAGYSRLMGEDEMRTMEALRAHRREVVDPKLSEHRGRLVNTAGDSVLAEFSSVVDAVSCAVEIQKTMAARNANVPEAQRILYRIGINVGDVIFHEGEVYGDGVNIAARLEQLCEPGSVFVSRLVHEQVGERLPYRFELLGSRDLKNISRPIHVCRVRWEGEPVSSAAAFRPEAAAKPRDPRPSLAVLPFVNLSGDPGEDYFVEGLTEDLTTDISRFSRMSVVARDMVLAYENRDRDAVRAGKELGVHHVLEGSVRRSGERVRINAHLIDTETGRQLWAQRYDGELKDLFDVQDQMTRAIVAELEVQILEGEQAKSWQRGTANPAALDLFRRSRAAMVPMTLQGFLESLRYLQQAVEIDPSYARAKAGVAALGMGALMHGLASGQAEMLAMCGRAADDALALAPDLAEGWIAKGQYLVYEGEARAAEEAARKALTLGPNANIVTTGAARIYLFTGRFDAAIDLARQVADKKRTVTRHPGIVIGMAAIALGRHEEALPLAEAQLGAMPDNPAIRLILAAAYSGLGRMTDAHAQASHLRRLLHGEQFAPLAKWMLPFVDRDPRERIVALLASADVR